MSRRSRLVLVPVLVLGVCIHAQRAHAIVDVLAGPKFGWTVTTLTGDNDDATKTKNSYIGGVVVAWQIKPWFLVQLEPAFTQKGADLTNLPDLVQASELRLNYFDVPLVAKFKYPAWENSRMGPFGVFGPVLSINTQAHVEVAGGEQNVNQDIADVDFGLAIGVGFDFDAGPGVATLDLRWVTGLTNVITGDAQQLTGNMKNQAMQLTASWWTSIF